MTQQRTYTVIQRDEYGQAVNTVTGLYEEIAQTLAAWLRTGDAYTSKRPWTCEIVREPTHEEQMAAVVDEWIVGGKTLRRADHLVACLRRVADALSPLGDREIPGTGLEICLTLWSSGGAADKRMAVLDELAALFGMTAEMPESGHYGTGSTRGSGLRLVTIVKPEPKPEPKPLVSDETIAQAEQISRMVAPMDLGLPKAECGCPIKGTGVLTYVDHCAACFEQTEHKHVGGSFGGPGENSAECACGTTFAGFDTHGEVMAVLDKHIANETAEAAGDAEDGPERIPAERVDELLRELNQLTQEPDEAAGVDWWDWIADQPEFDREATANSADTGGVHLVDGTVLVWQGEPAAWKRVQS